MHAKVLIDDLQRKTKKREQQGQDGAKSDLFAVLNGVADRRRQDRVLCPRLELVEPNDPGPGVHRRRPRFGKERRG